MSCILKFYPSFPLSSLGPIQKIFLTSGIAITAFFVLVGILSLKILAPEIRNEVKNHLISVRDIKKTQIQNFFSERYGDVNILSKNPIIIKSLPRFSEAYKAGGFDDPQYKQVKSDYDYLFIHFLTQHGYKNIYLVDGEGNIVYGVKSDDYLGKNLKHEEYSSTVFGEVFREGLTNLKFSDLTWNDKTKDYMCLGACPVYDPSNTLLGVVIVEIPYYRLDAILSQTGGLGKTGEIYIVGSDKLMRSKSRFLKQNTILNLKIDTEATEDALRGNTYVRSVKDYRKIPVLSAYTPLNGLRDVNWVLLVEKDETEIFYPFIILKSSLFVAAVVIIILSVVYLYFTLRERPVKNVPQRIIS
ncbi:MAG: hypothetical protein E3K32_00655 [wastewater metagenome]|nr:hypothetical protein [Candidatus Loosdrechtia aerotolerans]